MSSLLDFTGVVRQPSRSWSVTELLDRRGSLLDPAVWDRRGASSSSMPDSMPLVVGGQLESGRLYPDIRNPEVQWYIPSFDIDRSTGRPDVLLELFTAGDYQQTGVVGALTIQLARRKPQGRGRLRPIPIEADAILEYQLPLEGVATGLPQKIELGPLQEVDEDTVLVRAHLGTKELFDRIYQAMTRMELQASLHIRFRATVALEPPGQGGTHSRLDRATLEAVLATDRRDELLRANVLDVSRRSLMVAPPPAAPAPAAAPPAPAPAPAAAEPAAVRSDFHRLLRRELSDPSALGAAATERRGRGTADLSPRLRTDRVGATTPTTTPIATTLAATTAAATPSISALSARSTSARSFDASLRIRPGDVQGPPIVATPVEPARTGQARGRWTSSLHYPPALNPAIYLFHGEEDYDPGPPLLLVRHGILNPSTGDIIGAVYEDRSISGLYYYQPTRIRLARRPVPPYAPDLVVELHDIAEQAAREDGGLELSIEYRVEIAFRLLPFVDPDLLAAARAQLGPDARFSPIQPLQASLALELPSEAADGDRVSTARPEAEIDLVDGILDRIELSSKEFDALFADLGTPGGTGLRGLLKARLATDTEASIDVELNLLDTSGELFDTTWQGRDPAGLYRVTLRNRIESTVSIDAVQPVQLPGGARATAVEPPLGPVLPGAAVEIRYRVEPPDADVSEIVPMLETRVQPDLERLWTLVMLSRGYASQTFSIALSADPLYFGPPPEGVEPLVGLRVEFEADATVELTPAEPEQRVVLRMGLLAALLKTDAVYRYRYRVTNIHPTGEGARTHWQEAEGDLVVGAAPIGV